MKEVAKSTAAHLGSPAATASQTASAAGEAPMLSLHDVSKVYKGQLGRKPYVALDKLSCQIPAGSCTGLLGHNGAGKTTTIRVILGLVRPSAGEVLFEGMPLSTQAKAKIGYMPEVNKLPSVLTPAEILAQQLRLAAPPSLETPNQRKAAIDEALAEVGLSPHRNTQVRKLSKGMARRLAWAQAVIHRPHLLILDEPASGLDPVGRKQMLEWIKSEKQRGTTIVLCTHELSQVQALCDEVLILNRGRTAFSSLAGDHSNQAAWRWRQPYNIEVSGADEKALAALRAQRGLPAWQALRASGFATTLGFASYEAAAPWLSGLLADGRVILRFGDSSTACEDELMRYFSKENDSWA